MTLQSDSWSERGPRRVPSPGGAAHLPRSRRDLCFLGVSYSKQVIFTDADLDRSPAGVLFCCFPEREKKIEIISEKPRPPFLPRHASPSGTVSSQPVPHTVGQRCVNLAAPKHTQARCQELDYLREFSAQRQRRHTSLISATFSRERVGL